MNDFTPKKVEHKAKAGQLWEMLCSAEKCMVRWKYTEIAVRPSQSELTRARK